MEFRFKVPQSWRSRQFRYRMMVYRCSNCGAAHHSPRVVCRRCGSSNFRYEPLPGVGRLLAFTLVRSPPTGFEEMAPYIVGVVELEDGTRIFSQITDCDVEDLRVGMEVEQVVRKIASDEDSKLIVYGYKFRPRIAE